MTFLSAFLGAFLGALCFKLAEYAYFSWKLKQAHKKFRAQVITEAATFSKSAWDRLARDLNDDRRH